MSGLAVAALLWSGHASDAAPAAPVAIAQSATERIVREVRVTGTVTSPMSASLSAEVGGKVARLLVDEGDRAEPGQVLVELDRELASHSLATARAELERARVVLADAERRLEEGRRLLSDKSIAQSQFDTLVAEVSIATADLAAAQASARYQSAVLEKHRLAAPFPGVISRRLADVGEWVTPGTAVLELVATAALRIDFRVPQELYPRLNDETTVSVSLDALGGHPFAARIAAIVPVGDPAVRTFLLRVVPASDSHPAMLPGMSAQAALSIATGRTGVVVPRDAVLRYPDGRTSVWVLDRSGPEPRVSEKLVRLGLEFGDSIEITEGLASGIPVVVEGNEALQDGQTVSVPSGS